MAKKKFASPFVFTVQPVEDPVIGNASAHGYVDDEGASQAWPMPYGLWLDEVGAELDGKEGISWGDYKQWFVNNGLNTDLMEPAEDPEGQG